MAVGLQLPPFSKSSSWALANPIQLSDTPADSMTSAMSYQYSLPSGPGPGSHLENHPLNSLNNYHLPAVTTLPPPQPLHPHNQKPPSPIRRGASVGQKQEKMKRSVSTPNVLGQARQDQAESALSAEKRRNKLGYHRTSVACGHCRRRKIRCIPAPGDPQNRCSNCIRLKKECKFYAVDQQPQSDQRRDSDVQGTSTSSSPNPSAQPSSMQGLSYTHLAMPPVQELGSSDLKGARTDSFSPENKGPFSRPQEYGQSSAGWIPSDSAGLVKGGAEVPSSFWRMSSQESPLATGFSSYSPNMQQLPQSNWPPAHQDPVVREEMGWSVPQRSMSYSNHETLRHNSTYGPFHQPGLTSNIRDDFVPRPQQSSQNDVYAPSLTPGAHSISGTEASSTSTAAEVQTPQHSSIPLPPPFTVQSTPNWQQSYSYGNSKAALPGGNESIGWYYPSPAPHEVPGDGLALSYANPEPYGTLHGYPSVTQDGGR